MKQYQNFILLLCFHFLSINSILGQRVIQNKFVTLSNGKYQEFHDQSNIVEIGSVFYNTTTGKIVGLSNSKSSSIEIQPHFISRWMSPDPLSEEYSSWSPYNYVMNNPLIYIDPDGMEIVDAKGNTIYTEKGGWSANAPKDAVRMGNAMNSTRTGSQQFSKIVNSSTKIQMEISPATVTGKSSSGKTTYTMGKMIPLDGTVSADGKSVQMTEAKIVVYEGTINKFMADSKNSTSEMASAYQENTTTNEQRIGAVAGHEAEHTTSENVQENYENTTQGTSHDVEKKPREVEKQILHETGVQNLKPLKPIMP